MARRQLCNSNQAHGSGRSWGCELRFSCLGFFNEGILLFFVHRMDVNPQPKLVPIFIDSVWTKRTAWFAGTPESEHLAQGCFVMV
jgi:hypothetical protein